MDRGSAHLSPQATGREPDEPLAVAQRLSRLTGRKVWGEARFGLQSRTRLSLGSGSGGQPAVWKGGAESHGHIPAVVLGAVSCRGEFRMPEAGVATDTGQGPG